MIWHGDIYGIHIRPSQQFSHITGPGYIELLSEASRDLLVHIHDTSEFCVLRVAQTSG